MPIPSYVQGFPQDGSSLGSTKTQIRNNLDGTFQTLAVDHYDNNQVTAGLHKQSTYKSVSTTPTTAVGQLALYSKDVGGISQLFLVRDGVAGTAVALTPNPASIGNVVRATKGYSWLPGNILMQWGFDTVVNGTGSIGFLTPFASLVPGFGAPIVTIGPFAASEPSHQIVITATTASNFSYKNGSATVSSIYWMAIGPI